MPRLDRAIEYAAAVVMNLAVSGILGPVEPGHERYGLGDSSPRHKIQHELHIERDDDCGNYGR